MVTICISSLSFNNSTLCPHCIYVFCMDLRTDSGHCFIHHLLIGFYNRCGKCLQRGTDWFLIYSRLCFICKRLIAMLDTVCELCCQSPNNQGKLITGTHLLNIGDCITWRLGVRVRGFVSAYRSAEAIPQSDKLCRKISTQHVLPLQCPVE